MTRRKFQKAGGNKGQAATMVFVSCLGKETERKRGRNGSSNWL